MFLEFKVGDFEYRATKLNCFEQWEVLRRLLPVVGGFADVFKSVVKAQSQGNATLRDFFEADIDINAVVGPVTTALSKMPEPDSTFVVKTCLSKVMRAANNSWAPMIESSSGVLMFSDLDVYSMLQIIWNVLKENLGNFSIARPPSTKDAGRA